LVPKDEFPAVAIGGEGTNRRLQGAKPGAAMSDMSFLDPFCTSGNSLTTIDRPVTPGVLRTTTGNARLVGRPGAPVTLVLGGICAKADLGWWSEIVGSGLTIDPDLVEPEKIPVPTLVVGFEADPLVRRWLIDELVERLPDARRVQIATRHGHDGFLFETEAIWAVLEGDATPMLAPPPGSASPPQLSRPPFRSDFPAPRLRLRALSFSPHWWLIARLVLFTRPRNRMRRRSDVRCLCRGA
jgi:hypothetical protein